MRYYLAIILLFILVSINTPVLAQSMGVKLSVGTLPNTTLDVNGAAAFREGTALALANGVNSNITLADFSFFRITGPTAAFSITGFTNGTDGRILTIVNATTQTMTLVHQVTSSAENQLNTDGSTINIAANGVANFMYNATLSKWVVTGTNGEIISSAWALTGNGNTTAGTNFIGTLDAQALVFKTNNTEGVRILSGGNVAIGTTSSTEKLTVSGNTIVTNHLAIGPNSAIDNGSLLQSPATFKTMISAQEEVTGSQTTTYTEGILSHLSINATNNPTTEFYALDNIAEVKAGNIQNYTSVIGNYGSANHKGSGVVTRLYGIAAYAQNKAAGTVTDLQGMDVYTRNSSSGNVTNAYGIYTKGMNNTGTGTVTNSYGVFVDAACNTGGGIVTNDYGVFIEDHSTISTTHYNLYSKGSSAKNYFAGNVGIGASATEPVDALHIDKGTSARAYLRLTAGTTTGQTATDGFALGIDGSGNGYLRQYESSPILFYTNNTEQMRITSGGRIGIGQTDPNSTLEVNGSLSAAISTLSANANLNVSNHTVIITGGSVFSLPLASSCIGRIYVLVNRTSSAKTVREITTLNNYQAFSGTSNSLAANSSITLQSDGTNWYRIQ